MTKNVHNRNVGTNVSKSTLRESAVPSAVWFMYFHGDPLLAKNHNKLLEREYEQKQGVAGTRRKLERFKNEHPWKKSSDAFLNLFPQVAKDPKGFAMNRMGMSEEEQNANFDHEIQIFKEVKENIKKNREDSDSWKYFQYSRKLRLAKSPSCPTIPLLDYVKGNADRVFDEAELQIWLFLVMLEHESLVEGGRLGFSELLFRGIDSHYQLAKEYSAEGLSNFKGVIPLDTWVPRSNGAENLCTTRYRVMHHMLQSCIPAKGRSRNYKFLHDDEFQTLEPRDYHRGICMNTALEAFCDARVSSRYKNTLLRLFRSAEVFEMLQLTSFRIGSVSAEKIVDSYKCFNQVADDFYCDIKKYCNASS